MMMNLKDEFTQHLQTSWPGLQAPGRPSLDSLVSENLLSPFRISLPKSVLLSAQDTVATLYRLRQNKAYQEYYAEQVRVAGISDPGNKSIVMSYDFHLTPENNLKLIEVNTNASFLALGYEMYRLHGIPLPIKDFSLDEIGRDIKTELELQGKSVPDKFNIAIMDDHPEQQRLFVEFLVYDACFKSWGWNSQITDFRNVNRANTHFIYNRHTDFLLEDSESAPLRESFNSRAICFSPNPYEYLLLADKQRMIDWTQQSLLKQWGLPEDDQSRIQSVVPQCLDFDIHLTEEIWKQRKHLFFKPKRAFGSKQTYKGASISRKIFDDMIGKNFIAQEFIAAPQMTFETPEGPQDFKYDLRCYAYQDRLQLIVARLYQGQVTNLRTPLGGFACVEFF